ncbi:hypothetical protein EVAR_8412_1 [Eumeta japonica]|uniref:Uncharacterized protein n=1 Tax=Eumeta variegata TaxID=151549 RepID=A0A4C1WF53_EUMVA|nr:hypothetical protein EVAR_8412_1 [Eumeta japonica]
MGLPREIIGAPPLAACPCLDNDRSIVSHANVSSGDRCRSDESPEAGPSRQTVRRAVPDRRNSTTLNESRCWARSPPAGGASAGRGARGITVAAGRAARAGRGQTRLMDCFGFQREARFASVSLTNGRALSAATLHGFHPFVLLEKFNASKRIYVSDNSLTF